MWDIELVEGTEIRSRSKPSSDGALDSVFLIPPQFRPGRQPAQLAATSLIDGKQLWSTSLETTSFGTHVFAVDDLDGDGHPEIVLMRFEYQTGATVTAFEGRDGSRRWTWSARFSRQPEPGLALADLDGDGKRQVCLSLTPLSGRRRVVILDGAGHERAYREVASDGTNELAAVDLDGDKHDELLLRSNDRLEVWNGDLKSLWSSTANSSQIDQILPASPGRPAEILLRSAVGLDGHSGRPRWAGQPPLKPPAFIPALLDPGDASRMPRFLSQGLGSTVCRVALPTEASGIYAPPQGARVPDGLGRNDPRWTRPLPWTTGRVSTLGLKDFLVIVGLALSNVMIPLAILRLAARRRPWTMRVLLALPVAAAVPLMVFLSVTPQNESRADAWIAYDKLEFLLATFAGIPFLVYALAACVAMFRWQYKSLAGLAALELLTSLAVAAAWLSYDMRLMPAIERVRFCRLAFHLRSGRVRGRRHLDDWLADPRRHTRRKIFA